MPNNNDASNAGLTKNRTKEYNARDLLWVYASYTLSIGENETVDSTTKKLLQRLDVIDKQRNELRRERDAITTSLAIAGIRPPEASERIYTTQESQYLSQHPFANSALTDACLTVLRDKPETWFTKSQVEYLVARGGYVFESKDSVHSVNITLRRLAGEGLCEVKLGKGTRASKYRFVKDR
jgi:hypothetical protein